MWLTPASGVRSEPAPSGRRLVRRPDGVADACPRPASLTSAVDVRTAWSVTSGPVGDCHIGRVGASLGQYWARAFAWRRYDDAVSARGLPRRCQAAQTLITSMAAPAIGPPHFVQATTSSAGRCRTQIKDVLQEPRRSCSRRHRTPVLDRSEVTISLPCRVRAAQRNVPRGLTAGKPAATAVGLAS